ncbi:MAG: hypothetical protein LBV52_00910, partial [Spirochaetaceae bacterium]|nr:hypothetical protein [Spirochaetaceae bacterium]
MKTYQNPKYFFVGAALVFLQFFLGCSNSKTANETANSFEYGTLMAEDDADTEGWVNESAVEKAFTLDFTPEKPEPAQTADSLSDAEMSGETSGGGNGVQIVPGLRPLNEYKTSYLDPQKSKELIAQIAAAQIKASSTTITADEKSAFTVTDWGPQKFLSAKVQRPSLYVMFSQPVIPLASLGVQSNTSPFVTINPPIKGVFRWYGTDFLSFEGSEPCQSQQIYTINVNPEIKSIYGKAITGERSFSFLTETLEMKYVIAGEEFKKKNNFDFDTNNVPPEAAKQITIVFNYPVKAADIESSLEIKIENTNKGFSLKQIDDYKILADLNGNIDFDTTITVTLLRGAKSKGAALGTASDQQKSFSTPKLFEITQCSQETSYGKYNNIIDIEFSARLNVQTVLGAISTVPKMNITKDNIEVWGDTVRLSNLPLHYNDTFTINVSKDIKDVFGRNLARTYSKNITMPGEPAPEGNADFLASGNAMLESQFPPRFLFEYKNILPKNIMTSSYTLDARNNPFGDKSTKSKTIILPDSEKNYRYFEEIDLKPYLNNAGKGFVSFNAELNLQRIPTSWDSSKYYTRKNNVNIQVTDLGITARQGFNKTVVLVTSLKTGKPIEGALVKLISPIILNDKSIENISTVENFGMSFTDKNGFAEIETAAGVMRKEAKTKTWSRSPYILVEKDDDRAVFTADNHNVWRYNIYTDGMLLAEKAAAVTFLFTDRGLYKPGETLTFRGVDKTLMLGNYAVYSGDWKITLEKSAWDSSEIASLTGTVSESGGFYGTITIPEDADPGPCRIVYRRINERQPSANIPVTIAYFERLKFQASVSSPAVPVISGDEINLTLKASYLSGGSLSGAAYEASWYKQPSSFYPKTKETENY